MSDTFSLLLGVLSITVTTAWLRVPSTAVLGSLRSTVKVRLPTRSRSSLMGMFTVVEAWSALMTALKSVADQYEFTTNKFKNRCLRCLAFQMKKLRSNSGF